MASMQSNAINQAFYFKLFLKNANNNDDIEIPNETLEMVSIKEGILDIVPRMALRIADRGNFTENYPLYDGDVITIHFGASEEDENSHKMEFIISDIKITPTYEAKTSTLNISAYMNCPDFFYPYKNRALKGNSVDVLSQIAKEMGYGFVNRNSITTPDNMTWYQTGTNNSMMNHIIQRSYVMNDVPFIYGTKNMNFEYSCFSKCLETETKFIARYNIKKAQDRTLQDSDKGMMYYKQFDTISANGQDKRKSGYGVRNYNYDGSGGVVHDDIKTTFKQTDLFNSQKAYDGALSDRFYSGWNYGNAHGDYHKAIYQNYVFKNSVFSNTVELAVNPLTDISLMDGVMLDYPSFAQGSSESNEVWSGRYLAVGITHTMSYGGTYEKAVLLARNGINESASRKALKVN